jgi:hypothetical protein
MMVYIPADNGVWVDEHFERLARVVQDYDHNLVLAWIPPDKRTRDDKNPYAIIDIRINQPIMYASEFETPVDILERLFNADNQKGNVLDRLEARESAQKALEMKEWLDKREEINDVAKFFVKSPLHTVKHNGKKFDHQRRPVL